MPAGDAQRTWFPEIVAVLRRDWNRSMSMAKLIELRDQLNRVWLLFGDIKSVAFFHNRGMRYLFLGIIIRIRRAVVGQIHAPAFQQDVAIF